MLTSELLPPFRANNCETSFGGVFAPALGFTHLGRLGFLVARFVLVLLVVVKRPVEQAHLPKNDHILLIPRVRLKEYALKGGQLFGINSADEKRFVVIFIKSYRGKVIPAQACDQVDPRDSFRDVNITSDNEMRRVHVFAFPGFVLSPSKARQDC